MTVLQILGLIIIFVFFLLILFVLFGLGYGMVRPKRNKLDNEALMKSTAWNLVWMIPLVMLIIFIVSLNIFALCRENTKTLAASDWCYEHNMTFGPMDSYTECRLPDKCYNNEAGVEVCERQYYTIPSKQ